MAPLRPFGRFGFSLPPELPVSQVFATHVTRRRIIIGTATLAAGGAGLALGTGEAGAQADITMGEIQTQKETLRPEDGEPFAIWVVLSGAFEYTVHQDPAEWEVHLLVGDQSGNVESVETASGDATARSGEGTYALRGAITDSSAWDSSDFTVAEDEVLTASVPIRAVLVVRAADNTSLVQASEDGMAEFDVEYGGVSARLGAEATIEMQDDQGDATPTLPEA